MTLKELIPAIAAFRGQPSTFNPWGQSAADDTESSAVSSRLERLPLHLSAPQSNLLLVGEAPGYQGARCSGVAFTSEALLLAGAIPRIPPVQSRLSNRPLPWAEPSASSVWKALYLHGLAESTILWNAFPIHPFNPIAGPLSNRTPTTHELRDGCGVLELLIQVTKPRTVVAIGQSAHKALTLLSIDHSRIRHPAYGGVTEFNQGIADVASALKN